MSFESDFMDNFFEACRFPKPSDFKSIPPIRTYSTSPSKGPFAGNPTKPAPIGYNCTMTRFKDGVPVSKQTVELGDPWQSNSRDEMPAPDDVTGMTVCDPSVSDQATIDWLTAPKPEPEPEPKVETWMDRSRLFW